MKDNEIKLLKAVFILGHAAGKQGQSLTKAMKELARVLDNLKK